MFDIVYATSNKPKVRSLRRRLRPHGFRIFQQPLTIPEPRFDHVEDLAAFKALFARQECRQPVVTNDAAFYVEHLNGFPGTNVKFGLDTVGIDGLVRLAKGSPCHFRHALAYHDDGTSSPMIFADSTCGTIADAVRGRLRSWHWSTLSLIFIPKGCSKTLGEMTEREWVKHRDSGVFGEHYAEQFIVWHKFNRQSVPTP